MGFASLNPLYAAGTVRSKIAPRRIDRYWAQVPSGRGWQRRPLMTCAGLAGWAEGTGAAGAGLGAAGGSTAGALTAGVLTAGRARWAGAEGAALSAAPG